MAANPAREMLLRETLRPAPTTDAWRAIADRNTDGIRAGVEGLTLVTAADPAGEALAIALALREALEKPQCSAALVTPDRNLARRVAAELKRWNIQIDDSAGRPLGHTGAGAFLCLAAEAAGAQFAPVPLLALLKHPFATLGDDGAAFRARARELDRLCLRGPRPDPGLAGIARAIHRAAADTRNTAIAGQLAALVRWWNGIAAVLKPLEDVFAKPEVPLPELIAAHIGAAERLACDMAEECVLWHNPDGETAAMLVAALEEAAAALPPIEPRSYPALFRSIAMSKAVRSAFGQHPRLAILGPLEARLQHFDLTILGGLNEGVWPRGAGADPWFSRPMRSSLGLEQPERAIGLAAHDFAMLASGPLVLLSRALKVDGVPTIASRWVQRLQQLTLGLGLEKSLDPPPSGNFVDLAALMMDAASMPRLQRPAPAPPVHLRPRRLSITEIETWLRDPYAIYAQRILRLEKLDPLEEAIGPLERGNALHLALETFVGKYPGALPQDAVTHLIAIADQVFAQAEIPKAALAVWRPRFLGVAHAFVALERERRAVIERSHLEVKGRLVFAGPGGDFTLTGRADRIDVLKDGMAAIVDYKSGATPTRAQVQKLLMPQLPLEGAILAEGGFAGVEKRLASELLYISLADGRKAQKPVEIPDAAALTAEAAAKLAQRIAFFDVETTPYLSRVRPYRTDSVGDYDHLARVREWSGADET
jgi:ATP-dependent helicase/nuclease subunit B